MKRIIGLTLALILLAACGTQQTTPPAANLSGVWAGSLTATHGGEGTAPLIFTLIQTEPGRYQGTLTAEGYTTSVSGSVIGNTGELLAADIFGNSIIFQGTISSQTYSGTWNTNVAGDTSVRGTFSVTRQTGGTPPVQPPAPPLPPPLPPQPTTGSLSVNAAGVPEATVTVTGPGNFEQTGETPATFTNLTAGTYTITPQPIEGYTTAPAQAVVTAGEHTNVTITYIRDIETPQPPASIDPDRGFYQEN